MKMIAHWSKFAQSGHPDQESFEQGGQIGQIVALWGIIYLLWEVFNITQPLFLVPIFSTVMVIGTYIKLDKKWVWATFYKLIRSPWF
jgi:hypothetical protein